MFSYRPDQGVYARGVAFWAITAYSFLAGQSIYYWIQGFESLSWFSKRLPSETSGSIPVLGLHLTPALILGIVVCGGLIRFAAWKVANHPKLADLLIDTEAEMKKVTWPSMDDTKRSSLVVIGCTLFMLAFLFCSDAALDWLIFDLML